MAATLPRVQPLWHDADTDGLATKKVVSCLVTYKSVANLANICQHQNWPVARYSQQWIDPFWYH